MMNKKIITLAILLSLFGEAGFAQDVKEKVKEKLSVSGTMGISYEGYGLNRSPAGWTGYNARRPWNQVRFNFTPVFKFS